MPTLPRALKTSAFVAIGLIGCLAVLHAWRLPPFRTALQSTDNAYVRGQVTMISPQLAGSVVEVAVHDFQRVKAGDLIARIDDRIYEQRLRQAQANLEIQKVNLGIADQNQHSASARIASVEAQIEAAKTTLATADSNAERAESLLRRGVGTQSAADQVHSTQAQAEAALRQLESAREVEQQSLKTVIAGRQSQASAIATAEAQVRLAEIDLQNTRVLAPQDGRLGEVGVRLGQYVTAGTQLTALVPDARWIIANFKETQTSAMRIGQPATITVDALDHARLTGRIEAFAPAAGSEFSVLRPDNATGNFIKVAQRMPVRIAIDPGQTLSERLSPGMSVVVDIDTGALPAVR